MLTLVSGCLRPRILFLTCSIIHHREFHPVHNYLVHRFAFALVLLHRIGNVVLSHLPVVTHYVLHALLT